MGNGEGEDKKMKGVVHHRIDGILDEFMYCYRYGLDNGDVFFCLLEDIKRLYVV